MKYILNREKQMIANDIADLVSDANLGIAVTYKSFSSRGTYSATTGIVTETYASYSINAVRFPLNEDEIRRSGGVYQLGDYRYFIQASNIPTPKKDDRIVDGSVTRYPFSWSEDPLSLMLVMLARKI